MHTPVKQTSDPLELLERRLQPTLRRRAATRLTQLLWRVGCHLGRRIKRALDVCIALPALLLLTPLFLLVATLIKLTDGGPVLFWQQRVGKWGQIFAFPKFRSMVVNTEALLTRLQTTNVHGNGAITFKHRSDPRVTWIGRIIRKTSIDELPQLWCVLRGDMSLVGPRPALVSEVSRYSMDERRRLDATPGLTCTWQVSGRSDIAFPEQLRMDVEYIEQQSLWHDIRLLFKTIPAVITGRGAY